MATASGIGLTVIVIGAEVPEQPFSSVTCTVNMPLSLTGMAGVIAPFDHR